MKEKDCHTPIIFLTSESSETVDIQAMEAGALDYLIKGEITSGVLERSLRYALKLGETLERLRLLATRDDLSGLMNRRAFDAWLSDEMERSSRFSTSWGWCWWTSTTSNRSTIATVIPRVTPSFARLGAGSVRTIHTVDRAARYGGEEMAVVVTEGDAIGTRSLAERLVEVVAATPYVLPDQQEIKVTLSAGAAWYPEDASDPAGLIAAADLALYTAKRAGRNRALSHRDVVQRE